MRTVAALVFFFALSAPCFAQEFVVDWIDASRPDSQISVDTDKGSWEDYSEGGGSGDVEVDGNDLILKDKYGNTIAVLKDAVGAKPGNTGAVAKSTQGTQSIGHWECGEF